MRPCNDPACGVIMSQTQKAMVYTMWKNLNSFLTYLNHCCNFSPYVARVTSWTSTCYVLGDRNNVAFKKKLYTCVTLVRIRNNDDIWKSSYSRDKYLDKVLEAPEPGLALCLWEGHHRQGPQFELSSIAHHKKFPHLAEDKLISILIQGSIFYIPPSGLKFKFKGGEFKKSKIKSPVLITSLGQFPSPEIVNLTIIIMFVWKQLFQFHLPIVGNSI